MRIARVLIAGMAAVPLLGFGPVAQPRTEAQEAFPQAKPKSEAPAPAGTATPAASAVVVPQAEQFDLRSKSGQEYRIFVAGPTDKVPESGSPVVYLSDGNSNFPVLLNAARRMARDGHPAVVVGIGYPTEDGAVHRERRAFDLTPGVAAKSEGGGQAGSPAPTVAGNDRFLEFINDELKPVIEQKYKINKTQQTLFGHSFGGLFVLHVLFSKPESFQTYLASSPSIWWNNGSILAEEKAFTASHVDKEVKARLLITVGEWEQRSAPQASKERAKILEQRRMVGSAKELAARLTESSVQGLTVSFREFPEEEHGSVVLPAASRGMRFALEAR